MSEIFKGTINWWFFNAVCNKLTLLMTILGLKKKSKKVTLLIRKCCYNI